MGARSKSSVIVLGPDASLRVRQGALAIEHGEGTERVKLKLDIDDPPPCAILFDGRGEFLTGDAIRFCVARGIILVMPDGPGRMVTVAHSALEAAEGERLRDVGPAIIRAQCAADPVCIAREIAWSKIAADCAALGPRVTPAMPQTIARWEAALMTARSVAEIVMIEAKAASVYWRSHRDLGLIERKGGNLPASWKRFAQRNKGPEFLGNQHAAHPISAMINYCVVVEAGRLARALAGEGMALSIGFLHSDKHGRNSLVWDCIEPLRARINANVFKFIACREFVRADFPASGIKTHRIARPVIAQLLKRCLLPDRDILGAAAWLRDLVLRYGTPSPRAGLAAIPSFLMPV
jgi:CRISPR/Cas system-associated endonuclease Cas1